MAYKIEIFHLATIHYSNFTALHLFSWTIFCANYHGISMIKPNSAHRGFPKPKSVDFEGISRYNTDWTFNIKKCGTDL
jgi:hypothetical protein